MNNFFNPNGLLFRWLSRVYQIVALQVVFLLTCLPILTIGASLTALYATWFRVLDDEEFDDRLLRAYFREWRDNLKQATILWCGLLGLGLGAWFAVPLIGAASRAFWPVSVLFILLFAIFLLSYVYLFPLLARFENSLGRTLNNSFLLAMANMPYSILLVIINGLLLVVVPVFLPALLFLWFFCAFGLASFVSVLVLRHVFARYAGAGTGGGRPGESGTETGAETGTETRTETRTGGSGD